MPGFTGLEQVDGICGSHYFEIGEEKEIIMGYSLCRVREDCNYYGVTLKEVADYIGVSRSTIYRWIDKADSQQIDALLVTIRTVSELKC